MTGAKVTATTWLILLDAHIRITETHQLRLIALRKHSTFLAFTGGALRLVVAAESLAPISQFARRRALNVLGRRHQ